MRDDTAIWFQGQGAMGRAPITGIPDPIYGFKRMAQLQAPCLVCSKALPKALTRHRTVFNLGFERDPLAIVGVCGKGSGECR